MKVSSQTSNDITMKLLSGRWFLCRKLSFIDRKHSSIIFEIVILMKLLLAVIIMLWFIWIWILVIFLRLNQESIQSLILRIFQKKRRFVQYLRNFIKTSSWKTVPSEFIQPTWNVVSRFIRILVQRRSAFNQIVKLYSHFFQMGLAFVEIPYV